MSIPKPKQRDMPLLSKAYRKAMQLANDAEWSGDIERADMLYKQAQTYKEQLEAGDLYEVDF